jgi:hypothetical protein
MRLLIYSAAAAALSTAFASLPAQAQHYHHQLYAHERGFSGGFGTGPYWQGEPADHRPIWRYGYYQGNDPDQFIRSQIMRDPTNGRGGRR